MFKNNNKPKLDIKEYLDSARMSQSSANISRGSSEGERGNPMNISSIRRSNYSNGQIWNTSQPSQANRNSQEERTMNEFQKPGYSNEERKFNQFLTSQKRQFSQGTQGSNREENDKYHERGRNMPQENRMESLNQSNSNAYNSIQSPNFQPVDSYPSRQPNQYANQPVLRTEDKYPQPIPQRFPTPKMPLTIGFKNGYDHRYSEPHPSSSNFNQTSQPNMRDHKNIENRLVSFSVSPAHQNPFQNQILYQENQFPNYQSISEENHYKQQNQHNQRWGFAKNSLINPEEDSFVIDEREEYIEESIDKKRDKPKRKYTRHQIKSPNKVKRQKDFKNHQNQLFQSLTPPKIKTNSSIRPKSRTPSPETYVTKNPVPNRNARVSSSQHFNILKNKISEVCKKSKDQSQYVEQMLNRSFVNDYLMNNARSLMFRVHQLHKKLQCIKLNSFIEQNIQQIKKTSILLKAVWRSKIRAKSR